MASSPTLTTVMDPTTSAQIMGNHSDESLGDFCHLDDVFRLRGADKVQVPLLAFPKPEKAMTDFVYFTGCDLDRFIDMAAKRYAQANLKDVSFLFKILNFSTEECRME